MGDRKRQAAFTLIEILLSVTILALVVVFASQLIGGTQIVSSMAGRRSDADTEARMIFNRMAIDFNAIARRTDVNFYFHHQPTIQTAGSAPVNDSFYFFSEAPGYFANGDPQGSASGVRDTFSLVGYRISDQISGNARFQLERLGRGLHWNGSSLTTGSSVGLLSMPQTIAVNFSGAISDPYNNSSNLALSGTNSTNVPEWDVVGDEVFRMAFCFLLGDGTLSNIPVIQSNGLTNNVAATAPPTASSDTTAGYSTGSRWYDTNAEIAYQCITPSTGAAVWQPLGLQDVQAVVVALGILDYRSRILATNASLTNLVTAFQDFSTSNIDPSTSKPYLMGKLWLQALDNSTFSTTTGLAKGLIPGVRIYQRYFYVQ